ncbi:MAG TPA: hypothetical protein VJ110_01445 [Candidatus Nanoarchaeia archaeon]|nr:hypothetical protein [Candidatus Nanoarchaeia archaeon]
MHKRLLAFLAGLSAALPVAYAQQSLLERGFDLALGQFCPSGAFNCPVMDFLLGFGVIFTALFAAINAVESFTRKEESKKAMGVFAILVAFGAAFFIWQQQIPFTAYVSTGAIILAALYLVLGVINVVLKIREGQWTVTAIAAAIGLAMVALGFILFNFDQSELGSIIILIGIIILIIAGLVMAYRYLSGHAGAPTFGGGRLPTMPGIGPGPMPTLTPSGPFYLPVTPPGPIIPPPPIIPPVVPPGIPPALPPGVPPAQLGQIRQDLRIALQDLDGVLRDLGLTAVELQKLHNIVHLVNAGERGGFFQHIADTRSGESFQTEFVKDAKYVVDYLHAAGPIINNAIAALTDAMNRCVAANCSRDLINAINRVRGHCTILSNEMSDAASQINRLEQFVVGHPNRTQATISRELSILGDKDKGLKGILLSARLVADNVKQLLRLL